MTLQGRQAWKECPWCHGRQMWKHRQYVLSGLLAAEREGSWEGRPSGAKGCV